MIQEEDAAAITDCTKALNLNPVYIKCLLRRAELYEKTDKLDEALADYKKVYELDPSIHMAASSGLVSEPVLSREGKGEIFLIQHVNA